MRAILHARDLRNALVPAAQGWGYSTTPILAYVRLTVSGKRLSVERTNLERSVNVTADLLSGENGAACVEAVRLFRFASALPPGETITLWTVEGRLVADVPFGRLSLMTLPESDYPELSFVPDEISFSVPLADLRRTLQRSAAQMSLEEIRYYLNGVCLAGSGNGIVAVATNGHILSQIPFSVDHGALLGHRRPIVPRAAVDALLRHLPTNGDAAIHLSSARFTVAAGSVVMACKLIDGAFPDYRRVIPTNVVATLEINRASLSRAVRVLLAITERRQQAVAVVREGKDGRISLGLRNSEIGSGSIAVDARRVDPSPRTDPIEIGFNIHYLAQILAQCDEEVIRFGFSDTGGPSRFEWGDLLYVLMPMRFDAKDHEPLPEGVAA